MTFTELVTEVCARLNLTSTEASTRVGRLVNRCYKVVTAEVGISPAVRRSLTLSANTTIGSAEVTFTSTEKITRVWYLGTDGTKQFLDEVTLDELRDETPPTSDTPTRWAMKAMTSTTVVVVLDTLASTVHAMKADGYGIVATLSGTNEPAFPESYHDVLIEGVLKAEYKKLEKVPLANESKEEYERLLGKLRYWVAKSAYLRLQQGGRQRNTRVPRDNRGTP